MMNKIKTIITAICITTIAIAGPGRVPNMEKPDIIPDVLEEDVAAFFADAEKYGVLEYATPLNGMEFNPLIPLNLDPFTNSGVLGLCWMNTGYIEFNPNILEMNPVARRLIVYHELFHCLYGLPHIEGTIMHPSAPASITENAFRQLAREAFQYIKEVHNLAKDRSKGLDDLENFLNEQEK